MKTERDLVQPMPQAFATSVLVIEDVASLQLVYRTILMAAGHRVQVAGTAADGLALFRGTQAPVVLLDLLLPDRDGFAVMRDILEIALDTSIIVITAHGSINKAVQAMRDGAHEFLVKPFDQQRLLDAVDNARRHRRHRPQTPAVASKDMPVIGDSAAMMAVHAKIRAVAASMATVFITGESGTGKDLCARAVHDHSARAAGPFVTLNCGALSLDQAESDLFGHMKGAFVGGVADKTGALIAADGGTLYLDGLPELAPSLQTRLLRVLQTSMVQPIGAPRARKVNVRLICASNRDPMEAVRRGGLREDLYYRLYVVPIQMPPLRARGADAIAIAEDALARFSREEGKVFTGLSPEVQAQLLSLPWPGNVRQLRNVIRNVVVLNDGGMVTAAMMPSDMAHFALLPDPMDAVQSTGLAAGMTLAEIERQVIETAIARHGGSVPRAARELDIAPSTLYRKLETWAAQAK